MPLCLISVDRVDETATVKPHCTRFIVSGTTIALPSEAVQYETVDRWRASVCERARETGQLVKVTWRDSRFGRELVDVEIAS